MNDDLTRAQVQNRSRNQTRTTLPHVRKRKGQPKIAEDDPRWDGRTMGNKRVGPGYVSPGGQPPVPARVSALRKIAKA